MIGIDNERVFVVGDKKMSHDEVFKGLMNGTIDYFLDNYPSKTMKDFLQVVLHNFFQTTAERLELTNIDDDKTFKTDVFFIAHTLYFFKQKFSEEDVNTFLKETFDVSDKFIEQVKKLDGETLSRKRK